ncbi:MAG: elongation factor G, partial [Oscillospiraceae bacterium]
KMDSERSDYFKVLTQLKEIFGSCICPLSIPYVVERKVQCYVNVISQKAFKYDGNGVATICETPPIDDILQETRLIMNEAIAETDEQLLDKYLSGEDFTEDEIKKGLTEGIVSGAVVPVLCGSSNTLENIDYLMEIINKYFPSPNEVKPIKAKDKNGNEIEIKCDENDKTAAYVFKTVADPFIGKLSFVKVLSGKLKTDTSLITMRKGEPERIGKIVLLKGKKQIDIKEIFAGDIGVIAKLGDVQTGDTLCDISRVVSIEKPQYPTPCMNMAIHPKAKGDDAKIASSLQKLCEEDKTLKYTINNETHEIILSGLGDQHIDMALCKLKAKFGLDTEITVPIVPYRETIRKKVEVQGKHKKQTGGHGQFGDVWIRFEPADCEDLIFEEEVVGGSVPKGFFPAVEKGLRDSIKHGTIAGYPIVGLKAILYDGSYHPVDSSEMSFKMAASIALRTAFPLSNPVLLEPIGLLKAQLPEANTGDLMSDINKRRGRILGMNPTSSGKLQEIEAEVPMSEMADFTTILRSMTQGRGSFTFEFIRYDQLPAQLEKDVIANAPKREEKQF